MLKTAEGDHHAVKEFGRDLALKFRSKEWANQPSQPLKGIFSLRIKPRSAI
jgi:hypothetical protein